MRSLLTSLGIIIGVGSVIVMVAVGQGSQAQIAKQIASMGTNLIMVMPPRGPAQANRLTMADVRSCAPSRATSARSRARSAMAASKVVGGDSGYWSTTVYGVEPDLPDDQAVDREVGRVLHRQGPAKPEQGRRARRTVAAKLFGDQDPIGKQHPHRHDALHRSSASSRARAATRWATTRTTW